MIPPLRLSSLPCGTAETAVSSMRERKHLRLAHAVIIPRLTSSVRLTTIKKHFSWKKRTEILFSKSKYLFYKSTVFSIKRGRDLWIFLCTKYSYLIWTKMNCLKFEKLIFFSLPEGGIRESLHWRKEKFRLDSKLRDKSLRLLFSKWNERKRKIAKSILYREK